MVLFFIGFFMILRSRYFYFFNTLIAGSILSSFKVIKTLNFFVVTSKTFIKMKLNSILKKL